MQVASHKEYTAQLGYAMHRSFEFWAGTLMLKTQSKAPRANAPAIILLIDTRTSIGARLAESRTVFTNLLRTASVRLDVARHILRFAR
jgi:hypothetical protein